MYSSTCEVVFQLYKGRAPVALVLGPDLFVSYLLAGECFAGLGEFMVIMNARDDLLEAEGDEQAEDDGGDVYEEVAPGRGCVMRRMNVVHRSGWVR